MNRYARLLSQLLGGAAGLVVTGAIGVLGIRYAKMPVDVVAWATLAGAVAWWRTTTYFLDGGIEYRGKRRGSRTARRVKKLSYVTAFFVARALLLTGILGVTVAAVFFLIAASNEAWGTIVRFFDVTPPEISANIVIAVLGTIGAVITFFGARWAEGRRLTNENRRPLQRALYPRILQEARRILATPDEPTDLGPLRHDALLVASDHVLDKISQFEWLAEPNERAAQPELESAYDELVLAMREDLGFREDAEQVNTSAWRDPSSLSTDPSTITFIQRITESL